MYTGREVNAGIVLDIKTPEILPNEIFSYLPGYIAKIYVIEKRRAMHSGVFPIKNETVLRLV